MCAYVYNAHTHTDACKHSCHQVRVISSCLYVLFDHTCIPFITHAYTHFNANADIVGLNFQHTHKANWSFLATGSRHISYVSPGQISAYIVPRRQNFESKRWHGICIVVFFRCYVLCRFTSWQGKADSICMYICVCVHIYIYIHACVCVSVSLCVSVCVCMCVCKRTYTYTVVVCFVFPLLVILLHGFLPESVCLGTCVCVHSLVYMWCLTLFMLVLGMLTYMRAFTQGIFMCIYVYLHIYIRTYIYVYIYKHKYTIHKHTHMQTYTYTYIHNTHAHTYVYITNRHAHTLKFTYTCIHA
jgi:hypothetical protein